MHSLLNTRSAFAAAVVLLAALGLVGCATPDHNTGPGAKAAASAGPQLWAENCGRCHYIRSPNSQSDAQWEVVAMHMRLRANLTAHEYREILAFLKSAH
jgi:mono/diheme cytochrome c family protein